MSSRPLRSVLGASSLLAAALAFACPARADVVLDANTHAATVVSTVKGTPVAVRTMAITQVAVHDAIQSITGKGRPIVLTPPGSSPRSASIEAAVAAATRSALLPLVPTQEKEIEAAYATALAAVPAGSAKTDGIAAGERAAKAVLAARADDGATAPHAYRPRTTPGVYVPTTLTAVPHWGRRKPWLLSAGDQFRPGPPPALDSETWKKDLAEVRAMGGKNSTARSDDQTAMARFWDTTSPAVYWPVVRSVAGTDAGAGTGTGAGAGTGAGDPTATALLLARAAMAMDDALIAVFDAKYAYEFWRPITAIRNTAEGMPDAAWEPLVETPMHPEYPCAHCIVSAAVAALLEGEIGDRPSPTLRTISPTGGDKERTWANPATFAREVSEARICSGVHYRNSTVVGQEMGRKIGALARERLPVAAAR
jgi:hypothetical protein